MTSLKKPVESSDVAHKQTHRLKVPRVFQPPVHRFGDVGGHVTEPTSGEEGAGPFRLVNLLDVCSSRAVQGLDLRHHVCKLDDAWSLSCLEKEPSNAVLNFALTFFWMWYTQNEWLAFGKMVRTAASIPFSRSLRKTAPRHRQSETRTAQASRTKSTCQCFRFRQFQERRERRSRSRQGLS